MNIVSVYISFLIARLRYSFRKEAWNIINKFGFLIATLEELSVRHSLLSPGIRLFMPDHLPWMLCNMRRIIVPRRVVEIDYHAPHRSALHSDFIRYSGANNTCALWNDITRPHRHQVRLSQVHGPARWPGPRDPGLYIKGLVRTMSEMMRHMHHPWQ